MRPFILTPIALLLFLLSCKNNDKNFDGSLKNHTTITVDTNCINPWNMAFFETKTQSFDSIFTAVRTKLVAILGDNAFDKEQAAVLRDSLRKAIFSYDSAFIAGNIQIDTTNLLLLKDQLSYYTGSRLTPRMISREHLLTQEDLFTYQAAPDFEISYTIYPCIKKILSQEGAFKRLRKGRALPDYATTGAASYLDQLNIYNCILNLSIEITVTEKHKLTGRPQHFYEVKVIDTAKVFTAIDLLANK